MIIQDLKETCDACQGSGFEAGYNQWGSLHPNLSKQGSKCGGRGFILTALGQEVWNLFKPMIQEMIQEPHNKAQNHYEDIYSTKR